MSDLEKQWLDTIYTDEDLKLKYFKTLIFLYKEKTNDEYTFISLEKIMKECKIEKKKTLYKILSILKEKGYIDVEVNQKIKFKLNFIRKQTTLKKQFVNIDIKDINDRQKFFVEILLNKNYKWGKISKDKRYDIIYSYSEDEIKKYINNVYINYYDFLLTPYWNVIKQIVKDKNKKCEICGNNKSLNIHHKTYEHHFFEHLYLNDLKLLCKNCHKKIHNKI